MNQSCIFCKIINKQIPAAIVTENDHVLVIKDIAPKAPIHYLIIPKVCIKNVADLSEATKDVPTHILMMAQQLSQKLSGSQAFRLMFNNGADAGQSVFHLHCHFLSGKKMLDF